MRSGIRQDARLSRGMPNWNEGLGSIPIRANIDNFTHVRGRNILLIRDLDSPRNFEHRCTRSYQFPNLPGIRGKTAAESEEMDNRAALQWWTAKVAEFRTLLATVVQVSNMYL